MTENGEVVIEEEFLLFLMRNYNSTPTSSFEPLYSRSIRIVQHHDWAQENTSPYTPKIISIGPLHHGNSELQPMEHLKHKYLRDLLIRLKRRGKGRNYDELLNRLGDDGLKDGFLRRFFMAARKMEEDARCYYELSNTISSIDFVNMLVIDGCFLIEFFLKRSRYIFKDDLGWQLPLIKKDILLFENQIPFFVLEEFYEILIEFGISTATIVEIASDYLNCTDLWGDYYERDRTDQIQGVHLLHMYHKILFQMEQHRPPFRKIWIIRKWTMTLLSSLFGLVFLPMFFIHQVFFADIMYPTNSTSAMELEEAGVRFQGTVADLKFENGTLFIPVLTLNYQSFCRLKNLLAFEFYNQKQTFPYVHTYVTFLSDLIKHPGDVKVLEKHNIITSSSGGDESVRLVRDLLEGGFQNHETLIYGEERLGWQRRHRIRHALMKYCQKPRHRWQAKLVKDYFGNPWSTLGFLVGVLLLFLTALQTVFTVLSYYQPQMVKFVVER